MPSNFFYRRGGPVFTQKPFVKNLVSLTCDTPFFKFVCIQFFFSMAGRDYEQLNKVFAFAIVIK